MAYIVTLIALILAGAFALLVKVWAGFTYFVLSVLMLLALFWGILQIFRYFTSFKKKIQESYALFKAETINKNQLTTSEYATNEEGYKKAFKREILKEKLYLWALIIFSFGVAILFFVAMFLI